MTGSILVLLGQSTSRKVGWVKHVAYMGKTRNTCRIVVEKPEGKRPLGRCRLRWVDNIKIHLTI
jgi:hypothetical protein